MNIQMGLAVAILTVLLQPMCGNPIPRRATITGSSGLNGRCTIQVNVDGSAEIEVSGDLGLLRPLRGEWASWRRFHCNEPLPRHPVDFRLIAMDRGRSAWLAQDPRATGGRAVIHLDESRSARGAYIFDIQWRGPVGDWRPPQAQPPQNPWPVPGGGSISKAIQNCQSSVTNRLNWDGYPNVTFERTTPSNNPGRNHSITGTVRARQRRENTRFSFSCSVDFRSGNVRSIEVLPR